MFQTAKIVLVVSALVPVVMAFVTGPPGVRLQPPKVYPVRVVVAVLESEAVDKVKAPAGSRVAVSVTGTDEKRVFPSKLMVGVFSGVALAEVGIAVRPASASRPVSNTAVVLFDSDIILELRTVAMGFPLSDSLSCC